MFLLVYISLCAPFLVVISFMAPGFNALFAPNRLHSFKDFADSLSSVSHKVN